MYSELAQVRAELTGPGAPFEIEEVEVGGIAVKAWKGAAPSLRDVWLQTAGHGDNDYLVYEDERVFSVICLHWWTNNPGHALIIPKEHIETLYDMPGRHSDRIHSGPNEGGMGEAFFSQEHLNGDS